ncbi:YwdI family protein [Bacillus massiliglaciei]|uniref:YwdI family protein n=1 Tax=Bacillus massiliglaciei TaxID=1816693 RepID=UPI000DA5EFBF|nr:YwdI family protein [Bacillus massiliglaciei]
MDIPSKLLLSKMEELISKAREAETNDSFKGYILAIQSLCEVMTDDKTAPVFQAGLKPQAFPSPHQPEPVKMDEANGPSLFDF